MVATMKRACEAMHKMRAVAVMVLVQVAYAGVNIFYKLASLDGMDLRILVAYRFVFAFSFISPLAFFLERKSRPKLTWKILGQAFLCGLFGGSLVQNLYLTSLALTSATFASSMSNLIPAITFVLAVLFRLEKLSLKRLSGIAKVAGTLIGISGAMLLTFYKGFEINLWSTNIHLYDHHRKAKHAPRHGDRILGAVTSLGSSISYACWLIVQAKMSQKYPTDYSSTALMCFMGSIQAIVFALILNHNWEEWRLGWDIRLLTVAYTGIVGSGVIFTLVAWCVRHKGPLYVSVFNPLMLILVALAGSLMLDEKLHLGSVLGAVLIIFGLYVVLWGKGSELKSMKKLPSIRSNDTDHYQGAGIMTSSDSNTPTPDDLPQQTRDTHVAVQVEPSSSLESGSRETRCGKIDQ